MKSDADLHADIERGESWLKTFADPRPDAEMLSRIKGGIRLARECTVDPADAAGAVAAAKAAVRRELDARKSAAAIIRLHRWAPLSAVAAAAVFAVVAFRSQPIHTEPIDPELALFVDSLSRPTSAIEQEFIELESDLSAMDLEFADFSTTRSDDWFFSTEPGTDADSVETNEDS